MIKPHLPRQTIDIFEYLNKGHFISEDSNDERLKELYRVIDEENRYEQLHEYFLHIGFSLEKGMGYYYFSRKENKADLERKIERAYQWIDILDFLKTYGKSIDSTFTQGTIFSPHDIFEQYKINHLLAEKLDDLKRYYPVEKPFERIEKIIKTLKDETFIEKCNEFTNEYKILAAFHYLEKLVMAINITTDEHDEISQ